MGWQTLEHGAGQSGLAGTHLSGQQNKATLSIEAIF